MYALFPLSCTVGIIHAQGTEMCFGYNVASHLQVIIAQVKKNILHERSMRE
jgi:hypothetical protein